MDEPKWIGRTLLDAMHADQLRQHGGLPGIRDEGLIESALSRPRHKWTYGEAEDLADLAAAYGFGLGKNHGYYDGNKRIAFVAMYTFLGVNGLRLKAPEPEAVRVMLDVASGALLENDLAAWVRAHAELR